MAAADGFIDTNVLLYLLSADGAKADRAEELLASGAMLSVQVLNEFASVALRKFGMKPAEVRDVLEPIRTVCTVVPLTVDIHSRALALCGRYSLSFYDALIAGAALESGCAFLYSEDMQHGQRLDRTLTVRNPFRS
jgi:predicted nucleic acid-binding protein